MYKLSCLESEPEIPNGKNKRKSTKLRINVKNLYKNR